MDRSEEGPVQPSATLRDEFGNTCGDISRSLCTLDVSENPGFPFLGDNFEAQNTILGQIHVSLKEPSTVSTSAMHSLSLKIRGKGTLAIRTVQEGPVSVGAECTRKHADITEHALKRFVEDIRHFILEVLRSS
jgi:hypothetical protein